MLVRYRVDDLAARPGVSVDTVRFYQARDLLPPPLREGRIAWYSDEHLDRLRKIRDLKDKGFTLSSIKKLLDGDIDAADEALVAALGEGSGDDAPMTLDELAVELFVRFVRDPIRAQASSEEEAAEKLVESFRRMLPATTSLIAHHFRRVLLAAAQERIEK